MSTKNYMVYGPNFQLYSELFDESWVYLELKNTEFEASANRVKVAIPIAVWEAIRFHTVIDFSKVNSTDEELAEEAKQLVADYLSPKNDDLRHLGFSSIHYGEANLSNEDRVQYVLSNFKIERDHQIKLKSEIDAFKLTKSDDAFIQIQMEKEEFNQIELAAANCKMTVEDFVLHAALEKAAQILTSVPSTDEN